MGPPKYKELKRRCDFCDREFKSGELVAALKMRFEGGSAEYITIYCFNGNDVVPKCIGLWRVKYDVKGKMDWIVMIYEGKRKGGSGNTGRFPALI